MTKLKDLKAETSEDVLTSRKVGNHYEAVPMLFYRLRSLPQLSNVDLSSKLFQDEDFVIPPQIGDVYSLVKAKIGKLYLEWGPDGKGGFSLTIKYLDKKNQTLRSFLNLQNPRYSKIALHDLLPFSLSTYRDYKGKITRNGKEACEQRSYAYELKLILTKLLLDESLSKDELRKFQENYRKLYIQGNSDQLGQYKNVPFEPLKDITYFGLNPHKKPATLFEVSAKIGAIALTYLSISEEEIVDVLREYLKVTGKKLATLEEKEVQLQILNTRIDRGRVPLKSIIDDIEPLLKKAIHSLKTQSNIRYFSCNAQDFPLKNKTGAEIDNWLQTILYPGLSLKERKIGYLLALENIVNDLEPAQKKSLALSILNSPDHFLKKERHFFRSLEYSNDTFSIYQLVKKLMLGEQIDDTLIIHDEEHHQDHVLSRYI